MLKIAAGVLFAGILIGYAKGGPAAGLDIKQCPPTHFTVGTLTAGSTGDIETSWSLTLTRNGAAASYGAYTITYTEQGYDPANSTIEDFPDINPRHIPVSDQSTSPQDEEQGGGNGGTPPGQGGTPPGQGGTPPGQGGTPPGQGGTPPGQGGTPPGQGGTPPGQGKK